VHASWRAPLGAEPQGGASPATCQRAVGLLTGPEHNEIIEKTHNFIKNNKIYLISLYV